MSVFKVHNETTKDLRLGKIFEIDGDLNEIEIGIILLIWFSVQFFGNGLLIGLIQFDRFGEDPLKRRIIDQVSFNLIIYLRMQVLEIKFTVKIFFPSCFLTFGFLLSFVTLYQLIC